MRRPGLWAAVLASVLLAACASTGGGAALKPGDSRDAVQARWGAPRGQYDLPEGGKRLLYINQPIATETYVFDFDVCDRLVRTEQSRTRERFEAAGKAQWHQSEVLRNFGLPAGRDKVERTEPARWSYRFLDNRYPRLAVLHFGTTGQVVRVEILDDSERTDDRYL